MKRLAFLLLFLLVPHLARAQQNKALSTANAACTATSCLSVTVDQTQGGATLTVTANASGNTIQFEASGDGGVTRVPLNATPSNSSTAATSTTGTGTWQVNTAGYTNIYLRMSNLAGGTTTVSIIQSTASARAGGGGGGGGTVSSCATFANGDIAFYTALTTLGCNDQLQWNNANVLQYTGVPQSTFEPAFQNYEGTNPSKLWVADESSAGGHFIVEFIQGEAVTQGIDTVTIATNAHNQLVQALTVDDQVAVDNAQTITVAQPINVNNTVTGPGTITRVEGMAQSDTYAGSVQIPTSDGYNANFGTSAGTLVTTRNAFRVKSPTLAAASTVTNNYGFRAEDVTVSGATINAAVKIDAQTVGAANWGINSAAANKDKLGNIYQTNLLTSTTAPSVAAGGCGGSGASITINNGTAAFTVNVGTSNTGTCTITMPTSTGTDWNCGATDITTTSTLVSITKSVPGGTPATQITLQNYTDVSATHAWVDSDKIQVRCMGE